MTIDPKTLAELKAALLAEKEELEGNLERIAKPTDKSEGEYETSFDEIGSDRDDNATEVEQYTDNLPIEMALEKKLKGILESLEMMENGTYGICANCNQEISIDRLKASPSAKTCIKCS